MNKKAQMFEQFGSLAVGIVALAILLVVAFLIMDQGKEVVVDQIIATSYVNETQTDITFEVFTGFPKCVSKHSAISVSELYTNVADTVNIYNTSNVIIVLNTINFSNKSSAFNETTFNMSYSCKQPDEAYNSTEELQNATDSIPTWIPIIVITFIGVILLGLVALLRRTQRGP